MTNVGGLQTSDVRSMLVNEPPQGREVARRAKSQLLPTPCTIFARNAYLRTNQLYYPMCHFLSRLVLVAVAILTASCSSDPGSLELSFQYNKQPGPGSNQYAVWVENADGQVVKTLYVTEFTSKGRSRDGSKPARGYTYRTSCTPTWVQHVGAESLTDQQIDAFTGATPAQSGVQTFTWDFTDQDNQPVAKGTYRFYIEATYNGPSVVMHTGTVTYGAPAGDIPVETSYIEASEDRRDMIMDVKARLVH